MMRSIVFGGAAGVYRSIDDSLNRGVRLALTSRAEFALERRAGRLQRRVTGSTGSSPLPSPPPRPCQRLVIVGIIIIGDERSAGTLELQKVIATHASG